MHHHNKHNIHQSAGYLAQSHGLYFSRQC